MNLMFVQMALMLLWLNVHPNTVLPKLVPMKHNEKRMRHMKGPEKHRLLNLNYEFTCALSYFIRFQTFEPFGSTTISPSATL